VVADRYQGQGLGTVLLERLAAAGGCCQFYRFVPDVLVGNHRMLDVFRDAGFPEEVTLDDGVFRVTLSVKLCPRSQGLTNDG
jgi:GNAT superfamily N-acetyltransferase